MTYPFKLTSGLTHDDQETSPFYCHSKNLMHYRTSTLFDLPKRWDVHLLPRLYLYLNFFSQVITVTGTLSVERLFAVIKCHFSMLCATQIEFYPPVFAWRQRPEAREREDTTCGPIKSIREIIANSIWFNWPFNCMSDPLTCNTALPVQNVEKATDNNTTFILQGCLFIHVSTAAGKSPCCSFMIVDQYHYSNNDLN